MSISVNQKLSGRDRRKVRVRKRIFGTDVRPRMSVFRSAKHIFVQVIDDNTGTTLASCGTLGKEGVQVDGDKKAQAKAVGEAIAKACMDKQIEQVVFDRNGYRFHGRVEAVATGARARGLKF
jgi:large subunit ribosomal protein L18